MNRGTAHKVAEVLVTPIPFLALLDKPLPALQILDTKITWSAGYQAIQSIYRLSNSLPKISIPETLRYRLTRPEKVRLYGPTRFTLTGKIGRGVKSKYALDGQDIVIDGRTWVIGTIELGCCAQGRGKISPDGVWTAEKIVVREVFDA